MKIRAVAVVAALLLLGAAPSPSPADLRYFMGTWSCHGTSWKWAPLGPGSSWVRNVYGDAAHPDGTAVMGYVGILHEYVYRDFHRDGSYADLVSPGLRHGRWSFSGPYYAAGLAAPLQGLITYTIVSLHRYDRAFFTRKNGVLAPGGGDYCERTTP
jgi:hypothetical protein